MDKNLAIVSIMGIASSTAIMLTLIRAWMRRHAVTPAARATDDVVLARLSELQQQLDSMQVEIERIGEGQRFTTRLLAGQGEGASVPPTGR